MRRLVIAVLTALVALAPAATATVAVAESAPVSSDTVAYAPKKKKVVKRKATRRYVPPRTFQDKLNRAVAQVPWAHTATWVITDNMSPRAWAVTPINNNTVYVSPRTPDRYLLDVVRHEWAHISQGRTYGGINQAIAALAPWGGIEHMADCGVLAQRGRTLFYGGRCTQAQIQAASRILNLRPA